MSFEIPLRILLLGGWGLTEVVPELKMWEQIEYPGTMRESCRSVPLLCFLERIFGSVLADST